MKLLRIAALGAALALVAAGPHPGSAARAAKADKSRNVRHVAFFGFSNKTKDYFAGGTDIDFSGRWVYAMQQGNRGGVHVIDASRRRPRKVSFIPCPGEQNDVAVVKRGLIALGYHNSTCAGDSGGGVRLVDVSRPSRPRFLGSVNDLPGGTHTLTTYPGKRLVYASPGGLPTNGGAVEQIIDVSNPRRPKVAATFQPNASGCHDLSFHITKRKKLAFCPGLGETQIWDVSKPLEPQTIGHIPAPNQFFQHSAAATHDGKYLVVGDENFAALECRGGPTGALNVYDITDPSAPVLVGYFGISRGPEVWVTGVNDRSTWCTAHNFNFIPGTYTLVMSWYAAGMNVIDLSDPANPMEIEHYQTPKTNYWSAYWHDGRIWANDRVRGLDVFRVKGLREGSHHHQHG
jgi:hypothetical protein